VLFKKKKEKKYTNLKGRVQCNEDCEIFLKSGESFVGRINEFNWVGFVVDYIDNSYEDKIQNIEEEPLEFSFKMPREFGSIKVLSNNINVLKYHEIITGDDRLKLIVNVEDSEEINLIQEFVNYRNRRFARHTISRKSIAWLNRTIFLTFIYIVSLILLIAILISTIYLKFF
jgi:hypothetical protein